MLTVLELNFYKRYSLELEIKKKVPDKVEIAKSTILLVLLVGVGHS